MIKCWEKRTEVILSVFFRFRQVSFYIEIFENFYTKRLQVRKIYLSLHSRLRKTSNTAEHGAVVQLVRMRACHARGRGFEPHPHRLRALHKSEGLFRIWHLPKKRPATMPHLFPTAVSIVVKMSSPHCRMQKERGILMRLPFVRFSQSLTVGIRQRGRQEVDYQL